MKLKEYFLFIVRLAMLCVLMAFAGQAFAQADAPLNLQDALQLLIDNLAIILAVATPYLTTWVKRFTGFTGDATFISNIVINALTKGLGLFLSGQVTLSYAIVLTIVGVLVDKFNYDANKKQEVF